MKTNILFLMCLLTLISCNDKSKTIINKADNTVAYASFGDSISDNEAITAEEMLKKYETLKNGDTIMIKFKSNIKAVCKEKGCWMKLNLGADKEVFTKFKEYGFFVPTNTGSQEAIVSGKAFVSSVSVEEQKHYAEDDGKSKAAIDSIVSPKITYSFIADGVLIKK